MDRGDDPIVRAWRQIDDHIAGLPPGMRGRGRLLLADLGLWWSPTGRVDGLRGLADDMPLLRTHLGVWHDLVEPAEAIPPGYLSRSALLTLALIHLHEGIGLPGSAFDRAWVGLADELGRALTVELGRTEGGPANLATLTSNWRRFHEMTTDGQVASSQEEVLERAADRLAPFLPVAVCTVGDAGRADLLPAIGPVLEGIHAAISIRLDLVGLRNDLARGRRGPVVAWGARATGVEPTLVSVEGLAGALLLSGAIPTLAETCRRRLEEIRSAADDLGLASLSNLASRLDSSLAEMAALYDVGRAKTSARAVRTVTATAPSPTPPELVSMSIDAAERYLRADPSFRESWEVHRWGLAGAAEVVAPFPASLVLEVLARHGSPVGEWIAAFVDSLRRRRLAYYDHPSLPQVETDTLGCLLRLYRWTTDPSGHLQVIEEYLDLLGPRLGPQGDIPVWLVDGNETILLGEGCGVIGAGVVTGLAQFDSEDREDLIEAAGRRILGRFLRRGTAISVNYPSTLALVALGRLLRVLRERGLVVDLWEPVEEMLTTEIGREASSRLGTQANALLVTAWAENRASPVPTEWTDRLMESQRSDGRWPGEPLFFVPHRVRSVTWYASDLMTTALCYDALVTYRDSR